MTLLSSESVLAPARSFLSTLTAFDWFILILALWSTVRGLLRGLIRELFALVALITGILFAAWNYVAFAAWLAPWISSPASASIAAFLLLVTGITLAVLLVGRMVRSAAHLVGLGLLDRLGGALFGLGRAALLGAGILLAAATWLPSQTILRDSRLAPPLLEIAHIAAGFTPLSLQAVVAEAITRLRPAPRTSHQ